MMGWQGKITVEMPRRRATVTVSEASARFDKIEPGTHDCHVLGIFQCNDGMADVQPYFVCELHSGQNIYADPRSVRFVDTDENGEIIDDEEEIDHSNDMFVRTDKEEDAK